MNTREFLTGLPAKVNPAAIEGLASCFHFEVDGEGGGNFTVQVADGKCTVTEGLTGEPKCVIKGSDANLMALVGGQLNPLMALMTGKIKISNQGEMLKYAKIFGLM